MAEKRGTLQLNVEEGPAGGVNSDQSGSECFSEEVQIFSNRGLSQLLPTQLQRDLANQDLYSSNTELGTEEVELHTQVVDVEATDSAPEPEALNINDLSIDQVPEEAVEVTVWSSVDDTMTNQESGSYNTNDAANQTSEKGAIEVGSQYRIKRKAMVVTEETVINSRELFSQDELSLQCNKVTKGEAVRILGDMQMVCSLDVVMQSRLPDSGSSFSLFSTPSGGHRQQVMEQAIVEVEPAEVPVEFHEIEIPMANCSPVKKPRGINGVVPPRPMYYLPSFLGNLASLMKSTVWFKNPPPKRPGVDEEPERARGSRGEGEELEDVSTTLRRSPSKRAKLDSECEKTPVKKRSRNDEERRTTLAEISISPPGRPPAKRAKKLNQTFTVESDTEAEMTVINGRISDMDESSLSESGSPVRGVGGSNEGSPEIAPKLKNVEERMATGQESEEVLEHFVEREETTKEMEDKEKLDVHGESLNTLEVDVEGSLTPRNLVIVEEQEEEEATKDSTGNLTMGTPHYSLPPFQQSDTREMEGKNDTEKEIPKLHFEKVVTCGTPSSSETTPTTSRTPISSVRDSSYPPKKRPHIRNQRLSLRLNAPSHSSAQTIRYSVLSTSTRSHDNSSAASPSSSDSMNFSRVSNVLPGVASSVHSTYMSSALQSSRLPTPTLSDLWNQLP